MFGHQLMKLLHGKITVGLFDTRILKLLSDFTMGKKKVYGSL